MNQLSALIREFQIHNCRKIARAIFTIDSIFIFKIQFIYLQFQARYDMGVFVVFLTCQLW